MKEPNWVGRQLLQILHAESLAEFGGLEGLRDEGLLESALGRPVNLYHYEQCNDIPRLAAAYGFGLARNHPFLDGNKRAAFVAVGVFLLMNGLQLTADKVDAYHIIIKVAAGDMGENQFAEWIRRNTTTSQF